MGLLKNRDVEVGVLEGGEEVLVGGAGVGGIFLQLVSAGNAEA